jgi:hypothetical protein
MNLVEKQMLDILKSMRDEADVVSVKAEFEAEGTRVDELLRLVDIARAADLKLTVKVGGCEAIRDLYALSKYNSAIQLAFSEHEREDVEFLFNIETQTGLSNLTEMVQVASEGFIDGIVFGRVDFVGSKNQPRDFVNSREVTEAVLQVARAAKAANLQMVMGGAVSFDAIQPIKEVGLEHLNRFETRKVVFSGMALDNPGLESGLLNAVHFELLWLINKRDYYSRITNEDSKRIEMLDKRWKVLGEQQ